MTDHNSNSKIISSQQKWQQAPVGENKGLLNSFTVYLRDMDFYKEHEYLLPCPTWWKFSTETHCWRDRIFNMDLKCAEKCNLITGKVKAKYRLSTQKFGAKIQKSVTEVK